MLSPTSCAGLPTKTPVTTKALLLIFERVLNYIPIPVTVETLWIACKVLA